LIRPFPLPGAVRNDPAVAGWFGSGNDPLQQLARHWFGALRACGDDVCEVLHDGHPTACVGGNAFAHVNVFTAHVNLGFFNGSALPDPTRLLEGSGKFMRHVKLRPGVAVNEAALLALIAKSCALVRGR
jgi:hypothetical protein